MTSVLSHSPIPAFSVDRNKEIIIKIVITICGIALKKRGGRKLTLTAVSSISKMGYITFVMAGHSHTW